MITVQSEKKNYYENFLFQIEICGCKNGGSCTVEGITDVSANPLILACICPSGIM